MMKKNYYSGLLHNKCNNPLGKKYNSLTKPLYSLIAAILLVIPPALSGGFVERLGEDSLLVSLAILISLFIIFRTMQSIRLAKKEYKTLPYKPHDSIIFGVVAILLSGGLIKTLYYHDSVYCFFVYYFFAYSLISLLATGNFISLYHRLGKGKGGFDYICGMRVQLVNAVIFVILAILFFVMGIIKYNAIQHMEITYVLLSLIICLLLVFNSYHSYALTYFPKIILSNALEVRDAHIGKIINIEKAECKDLKRITVDLITEFGYIYEYIFAEKRHKVLRKYIHILLTSSLGFGKWGHIRFYNIVNGKRVVGWMKIDTIHQCWIYTTLEKLLLFIRFTYYLGIRDFYKSMRRAKKIIEEQPQINKDTFVLSYIVIRQQYRKMNYGCSAVELLKNAFFHSQTNNINVKKMSLLVRSDNIASMTLFRKLGFKEIRSIYSIRQQEKVVFQYEK